MAGPSTASEAQLTFVFSGDSAPTGGVSTLGIRASTGTISKDLLAPIVAAIKTVHIAMSCESCVLSTVEMKIGPNDTGPTYIQTAGQAGGRTVPAAAPNTATIIRKTLASYSAKFSGRMYWPGVPEGLIDSKGFLDAGYVTDTGTAWANFKIALGGFSLTPVVFHNGTSLPTQASQVSSFDVSPQCGTQRRRMRR